jgi:hypothetical protein
MPERQSLRKQSTLNKSTLNTQVETTEQPTYICIQSTLKGTLAYQGENISTGWFVMVQPLFLTPRIEWKPQLTLAIRGIS